MTLPRALLTAGLLLLLAALAHAQTVTLALAWEPGLPLTPTDGYVLVRNGVEVQRPTAPAAADPLPGPGTYTYTVQALAGVARSAPSAPLTLTAAALPCALLQTATQLTLTCATVPAPPPGPYPLRPVGTLTAQADSAETVGAPGHASLAVDGLTSTLWHTPWSNASPPLPHTLTLDLGAVLWVEGLAYLPRQDGNLNGTLTSYRLETSTDLTTWTEAVTGTWPLNATEKTVRFPPVHARAVRLVGLVSNGTPYASAAEVGVYATEGGTP